MTEIKYTERGDYARVSLSGHAMFSNDNDIVCAGVSAITYQMLNVLSRMECNEDIDGMQADIHDGFVIVTFRVLNKDKWDTVWDVIRTGYENIAESYPENVRFVK